MLENFAKKEIKHLGVDPSANVVEEAKSHGVNSVVDFLDMNHQKISKQNMVMLMQF